MLSLVFAQKSINRREEIYKIREPLTASNDIHFPPSFFFVAQANPAKFRNSIAPLPIQLWRCWWFLNGSLTFLSARGNSVSLWKINSFARTFRWPRELKIACDLSDNTSLSSLQWIFLAPEKRVIMIVTTEFFKGWWGWLSYFFPGQLKPEESGFFPPVFIIACMNIHLWSKPLKNCNPSAESS